MKPQNILLIHVDQHRFDSLSCHGHRVVKTPHIDRLAAEGVDFTHAFSPAPVCVPARASLLSGQWATGHLSIANTGTEAPRPLRADLPLFPDQLKQAGFYLGYVGKWAVDVKKPPTEYGFDDYVGERQYDTWRMEAGFAPKPRENGFFGETDPHIDPAASRLAWGADQTIALLKKAAGGDRPFFIRWDPSEPHLPNVVPEPYASMYDPKDIPPWPNFHDDFQGKPYIQRQQLQTWQIDDWTWDDWAPIVARYMGEVSLLDAQVGRLMKTLETRGLSDDTAVIYTSDHGDMCGSHGMIDKHYVMYDEVVRVPLIVRWPGSSRRGLVCDDFVCSAVDLASTICHIAGAPIPKTFQGQSLVPVLLGDDGGASDNGASDNGASDGGAQYRPRDDIFATYHGAQMGLYSQRMLRNKSWKYVFNATAEDELYDLANDPGELVNLAADPQAAPVLARMRERLLEWMEATDDPLNNVFVKSLLQ